MEPSFQSIVFQIVFNFFERFSICFLQYSNFMSTIDIVFVSIYHLSVSKSAVQLVVHTHSCISVSVSVINIFIYLLGLLLLLMVLVFYMVRQYLVFFFWFWHCEYIIYIYIGFNRYRYIQYSDAYAYFYWYILVCFFLVSDSDIIFAIGGYRSRVRSGVNK